MKRLQNAGSLLRIPIREYAFDQYKSKVAFKFRTHRKQVPPGAYLLLLFPATSFGLCVWQVLRLRWKLRLMDEVKQRVHNEPIALPKNLRELSSIEFAPVKVRGEFVHAQEFVILPRHRHDLPVNNASLGSLIGDTSHLVGGLVVTPFKLADRNLTILVARGWVPKDKVNPETRKQGQVNGVVEIVGLTRNHEQKPFLAKRSQPLTNFYNYRDVESMAYCHQTAPVYLEAVKGTTVEGGPIGGQSRISLRNEHTGYALTWLVLGGVTTYVWLRRFYKIF